jgi:hypothetical protein
LSSDYKASTGFGKRSSIYKISGRLSHLNDAPYSMPALVRCPRSAPARAAPTAVEAPAIQRRPFPIEDQASTLNASRYSPPSAHRYRSRS